ncbi:MAG: hypothetical protein R6X14_02655 [bacterium]
MKYLLTFLFLVLLAGCGGPEAADVEPYAPELPVEYAVRLPHDFDPTEDYPLVVALHGYDRTEAQATALWDAGFFFMPEFILLAIRAPFDAGVGYAWYRDPTEGEDPATARRRSARTAEELLLTALEEFEAQYLVDANQRVLLGFGQGAGVACWVAPRCQELFSALALFGRPDLELAAAAGTAGLDQFDVFVAGPGDDAPRAEQFFRDAGAQVRHFALPGPAASAAALRAMQNEFDISAETAPEDDLGYDDEGEPVPGARLQPADWGDEPATAVVESQNQAQAR